MKKNFRSIVICLLLAMLVLGLAGCAGTKAPSASPSEDAAATPAESAAPAKTYVIYSDNAFAPFEFLDTATNKYTGVDMELLAAIA